MKTIVVAAVMAAGIGLMGMTQTMAAPAGGVVIGQAVSAASPITSARWPGVRTSSALPGAMPSSSDGSI
jgi:hypothetical protein